MTVKELKKALEGVGDELPVHIKIDITTALAYRAVKTPESATNRKRFLINGGECVDG